MEPLIPDASRQAVDSLKGYVYQLWQTLHRWCLLSESEQLFLEGAEDLDILRCASAETVQVKSSPTPITLASASVSNAIAGWWGNQERNPGWLVSLSFVTVASVGLEKERPFGSECGLHHWDRCKLAGSDLGQLRAYLATRPLPAALVELVKGSTDSDIRDRVLRRISWLTSAPAMIGVEDLVRDLVVGYADRVHDLPPSEATFLVPLLLGHVAEVALRPSERRLTRRAFAELVDSAVRVSITRSEYRRMRRRVNRSDAASVSNDDFAVPEPADALQHVGPPPSGCVRRTALVEAAAERLGGSGILVLTGSTGMGKSTLARALAARSGERWRLVELGGLSASTIATVLRRTASETSEPSVGGFLLDDLNFSDRPVVYERSLATFLTASRLAARRVVITTQGVLPARIALDLGVTIEAVTITVPPLLEEDVVELVLRCGCPVEASRGYGQLILTSTSGHPLLAHARGRAFQAKGWPSFPAGATELLLGGGADLVAVQRDARRRLHDDVQTPQERSFIYRLSAFSKYFRKGHALALAPEGAAGELFDRLLGPWIETHEASYYCLSPLLAGIGREMLEPDQFRLAQAAACNALLTGRKFGPIELSELLLLSLAARYPRGLFEAYKVVNQVPPALEAQFMSQIEWLTLVKTDPSGLVFAEDRIVSMLLREVQFRAALAVDVSCATEACLAWEQEVVSAAPHVPAQLLAIGRLAFVMRTLYTEAFPMTSADVVRHVSGVFRMLVDQPELSQVPSLHGYRDVVGWRRDLMAQAIRRHRGRVAVAALLGAIESLPKEEADPLLGQLSEGTQQAWDLAMSALSGATEGGAAAWAEVRAVASDMERLGRKWSVRPLVVAACRLAAILISEYEGAHDAALAGLDAAINREGADPLLEECRARILAAKGNDEAALEIWRRVLPTWSAHDTTAAFSYRDAAMAAGRLDVHDLSADLFGSAELAARAVEWDELAMGLAADRAVALFKCGRHLEAKERFRDVVRGITEKALDPARRESILLHRYLRRALGWAFQEVTDGPPEKRAALMPEPGRISDYTASDPLPDEAVPTTERLWELLVYLEVALSGQSVILAEYRTRFPVGGSSAAPGVDAAVCLVAIRRALRVGSAEGLASNGLAIFREAKRTAAARPGDMPPEHLTLCLLSGGLLVKVARQDESARDESLWRRELDEIDLHPECEEWLAVVVADPTTEVVRRVFWDRHGNRATRLAAATRLLSSGEVPLRDQLHATAMLIGCYCEDLWREEVERDLSKLVCGAWRLAAEERLFRFRAPSRAAALISACNSGEGGFSRAARVALRAADATGESLGLESHALLARLAGEE